MIPRAVAASGAALALLLAAACGSGGGGTAPGAPIPVGERKTPSTVTGEDLEGKPLDLASFKGKVTVVNFWASWCGPCRGEAETLEYVYKENKDKGVEFVGVDIEDTRDGAKAFTRTFGTTYPSFFDPEGKITQAFSTVNPSALPTTLILDRKGRVAVQFPGLVTTTKLEPALAEIVAEQ
ncbi:TlpA disulfide reductase family protein [Actinocorallia sp. A-T 12471]|uniref:TlpA family protein disulfide reductase n=1 Tax=Actinocorallia sp. A-T 12471 TaxID=3089813 RepID=UPI0029CD6FF9|nr:TlpA disulfide reductase family protein [Actinocorallia sp. A-T 12471]MDX6741763.1 TlpA disulfide reductase family protein [Actinocorallia sp. A-T 12471]